MWNFMYLAASGSANANTSCKLAVHTAPFWKFLTRKKSLWSINVYKPQTAVTKSILTRLWLKFNII